MESDASSEPQESITSVLSTLEGLPRAAGNRVQGKSFMMTWSQSPMLSRERIRDHLKSFGPVLSMAVAQERHQDHGIHYHAAVNYEHQIRRSPNAFNIMARHPNIRVANAQIGSYIQSLRNIWNYVLKSDPTPLIEGKPTFLTETRKRKRDEVFTEAIQIAISSSVKEATNHLMEALPYEFVTKFDSIERALTTIRSRSVQSQNPARELSSFPNAPAVPEDWHNLFLSGGTGLGKTQFARALLPEATVVRHTDQLRNVDFSKGVIFDDFGVSHWPAASVIHLLDWDEPSGINIKHGHVVIPRHTRKIFTYNSPLGDWVSKDATYEQVEAMKRRVEVVEINRQLY